MPHRIGPRVATSRPGRARKVLVAAVILVVVGVSLTVFTGRVSPKVGGSSSGSAGVEGGPVAGLPSSAGGSAGMAAPRASGSSAGNTANSPSTGGSGSTGSASVPPLPSGIVGQSARVEANGTIDLTIGDGKLEAVLGKLTFLAGSVGGFVSSTQAQTGAEGSKGTESGTVVLRVPEASFGTVVTQVQHLGRATAVTTTANDVHRAVRGSPSRGSTLSRPAVSST